MAESAQSAVDSLLGRLTSALLDEAQLLSSEVQFIKREMEIMSGFVLDVSEAASGRRASSNQVRALARQVQELAYDSQGCIDRYVQTFGGGASSTAGSICRAPRLLLARQRIAMQLQELQARALELGERRQRYGVTGPSRREVEEAAAPSASSRGVDGGAKAAEGEQARRRHVLSEALALLDADAHAAKAIRWRLTGEPWPEPAPDSSNNILFDSFYGQASYLSQYLIAKSFDVPDLYKWLKGLEHGSDSPAAQGSEALSYLIEVTKETSLVVDKWTTPLVQRITWLKDKMSVAEQPSTTTTRSGGGPKNGMETTEWMMRVFGEHHPQGQGLRVLFVPSPPPAGEDLNPHDDFSAKELGRRAYNHPLAVKNFDCRVCIDANIYRHRDERLRRVLHDLISTSPAGADDPSCAVPPGADDEMEELQSRIQQHLRGKKFLIVLDDPEDDSAWEHIRKALPAQGDFSNGSAVIVTPAMDHQQDKVDGRIIAKLLFSYYPGDHFPYKAADLSGSDSDVVPIINKILMTCCLNSFSTKMVFHALYADPHRSKAEWDKLLPSINEFSTMSNARHLISFCYDNLPSSYRNCLLYLRIFPPNSVIRMTILVRRWATERLITKRYGLNALDEADRCFDALVDRHLLLPGVISREGKVKSGTVHPHVLSFISWMPTDVAGADGNTDLPPDLARHLSIRNGIQLQMLTRRKRADRCSSNRMAILKSSFATEESENSTMDILTVLNLLPAPQLGLIKVLDLEGCPGLNKKHLKNICNKIFQLRYLSIRNTDIKELPKEVEKLQDLEVFDIKQTKIQAFPAKSIILRKLVWLIAGQIGPQCKDVTGSGDKPFSTLRIPDGIGSMENIEILSHIEVSKGADGDALENVGRLQQLRALGVVIHGKQVLINRLLRVIGMLNKVLCSLSICIKDGDEIADMKSTTFSIPRSLVKLNISGKISGLPTWIKELEQLSRIILSHTSLEDIDIRILGNMVNLRFIMLGHKSYTQKNLTFRNGFRKLEVLVIESSDISDIHYEQKVAPKLQKIVWTSTCKIETLQIENLPSLKEIELNGVCNLLSHIRKSVDAHQNHPQLTHNPPHEETSTTN